VLENDAERAHTTILLTAPPPLPKVTMRGAGLQRLSASGRAVEQKAHSAV